MNEMDASGSAQSCPECGRRMEPDAFVPFVVICPLGHMEYASSHTTDNNFTETNWRGCLPAERR